MRSVDIDDDLFRRIEENWSLCEHQQDRALSLSMRQRNGFGYLHFPPLVEHNISVRSVLAPDRDQHPSVHSAGMFFNPNFRSG